MKKTIIVIAVVLIILSLTIVGCEQQTMMEKTSTPLTDQEILAQHPDDLDNALNDLTAVDKP